MKLGKKKRESSGEREVEKLKGMVRSLQKELKHLRKKEHMFDDREYLLDELPPIEEPREDGNKCKCGSQLKFIDLGIKSLLSCDNCGYRKTFDGKKET